jgi:hypothetical protein
MSNSDTPTKIDVQLANLAAADYVADNFAPVALRLFLEFSHRVAAERDGLYPPSQGVGVEAHALLLTRLHEEGERTLRSGPDAVTAALAKQGIFGQDHEIRLALKSDLLTRITDYEQQSSLFF